ncbi:MAG: hypothetical protein FJZ57_00545 [Chlamydiae bacterium]|nr:hypothetical protein [Chlamydiota bacterium]
MSKIYDMIDKNQKKDRFYAWASTKISSAYAPLWLFFIYLSEMFHCLPLDPVWVLFGAENRSKKIIFTLLTTLASVLTAIVGYCLGVFTWDLIHSYILDHLISKSLFEKIVYIYQKYEALAVVSGALLPFPFKVITISAGVCKAEFFLFIVCILIGRLARFLLLGQVIKIYGEKIREVMQKYFSHTVLAVVIKIMLACLLLWWM